MGLFSSLFGGKKKQELEDNFGGMRASDIGHDFRSGVDEASPDKVWKDYYATREMLMAWPHLNTLEGLEAQYTQAWETKEQLPNGRRVYSSLPFWALAEMDRGNFDPEVFVTKTRELAAGGSPFWSALYALVLVNIGDKARGTKWAHETTDAQFAAQGDANAQARAVLDATAASAGDLHFWHEVNLIVGISENISREEFDARFERLWSLDRDNLAVLPVYAFQLLPRWKGSVGEVHAFAQRAAAATKETFGMGAYAVCFYGFIDIGSLTPAETGVDVALLHQGFADLKSRYKGPFVKSEEVAGLAWVQDWDAVADRYNNGFRKYVADTWSDNPDKASVLVERSIRRAVTGKE